MANLFNIPTAGLLAIHVTALLAKSPARPGQVKKLARILGASPTHLSKVLQKLERAGFVRAKRGPVGGFVLVRAPKDVSVLDVYEAVEGKVDATGCPFGVPACGKGKCVLGKCFVHNQKGLAGFMGNLRLSELRKSLMKGSD